MNYSVAITEQDNMRLCQHLLRRDGQEDLCFALYNPAQGKNRFSGLLTEIIFPVEGERNVHGNVSFNPEYLDRVMALALERKCGICFMHSHPSRGWQGMSRDDILAEEMLAPRVKAVTGLPLLGMTVGTDQTWSGRFWIKTAPKTYQRQWCSTVRVVGRGLRISFNDQLMPRPSAGSGFQRTVSAWGEEKQGGLARLTVAIAGLGSVGSVLAEALLKTGVRRIILIDFDRVELKNMDRLQGVGKEYIGRLKVDVFKDILEEQQLFTDLEVDALPYSIVEQEGLAALLDCDVIFSCVDRPWPRYVLDKIAYANLIPVIDGGIDASCNKKMTNLDQARWRAHTAGPHRRCLHCLGQYNLGDVSLEQSGVLEDETYIKGLPKEHFINRGENVFVFSISVAAMEMQQFLSLYLQPRGQYYGPKEFDFNSGNIDFDFPFVCDSTCRRHRDLAEGDKINLALIAEHPIAEKSRSFSPVKEDCIASAELSHSWLSKLKAMWNKFFNYRH